MTTKQRRGAKFPTQPRQFVGPNTANVDVSETIIGGGLVVSTQKYGRPHVVVLDEPDARAFIEACQQAINPS